MQDEWPQIVSLIRSYAARKYGQHAIGLSLHFQHGQEHREPFPLLPLPTVQTSALPPATSCPWASGDEPRMRGDGRLASTGRAWECSRSAASNAR